jgi:predicted Na+-dependent transporter
VHLAAGAADLSLSAEIALFLAKMTPFSGPLVARWALGLHVVDVREWPFLVQLIGFQIAPLYAGRYLCHRRRDLAERASPLANIAAAAIAAILVVFVVVQASVAVKALAGDRGWLAVGAVCLLSPLLAWIAGGRDEGMRHTLSIQANARELALALPMARFVSDDERVHAAVIAVWAVSLAVALLVTLAVSPRVRADTRAT